MKVEDVKCKNCGAKGEMHGCDHCNDEGPWNVVCADCGEESGVNANWHDAWQMWKNINVSKG
jgi:hypothetical protein